MEHRIKYLLSGRGFYGALALCILAVGVGGYFLLLREEPPAETAGVQPDVQAAAPVTDLPEHEPAGGDAAAAAAEEPEEVPEAPVMPEAPVVRTTHRWRRRRPWWWSRPSRGRWWRPSPWTSCCTMRPWTTGGPTTAWTSPPRRAMRSWRPARAPCCPSPTTR